MIRAVLDTNVVISALIYGGQAGALVPAWQHRRFTFLVSKMLLAEYVRVLHYPKFQLGQDTIRALVEHELMPFITPVIVRKVPQVIKEDPSDNHILACAVAGRADVIATGDHHLLTLKRYRAISIVSLHDFLKHI